MYYVFSKSFSIVLVFDSKVFCFDRSGGFVVGFFSGIVGFCISWQASLVPRAFGF